MHTCTNCGSQFTDKYCSHCGMKANDGHIYFKDQLHDAMYYVFSLDSPLWKTFKGLMTNPGKVGHEYIAGKRKSYYTPIKYFILCSAIYFLVFKISGYNPVKSFYEAIGKEYRPDTFSDMIRNNLNYFIFLLVITMPIASRALFPKQKQSFPENIAYSFFIIGHFMLLNTVFIPLVFINPYFAFIKNLTLLYIAWGIGSINEGKIFWRLIRSFLAMLLGYLLYIILVSVISFLISSITHH
ncbi:MAG: DUF3667 domain-containing protein [Ignavibacteriae bacterium]|nr:DUF3667 domain-containing protein [Ignavibacteriota bacterium]MCB9244457.1 DUF3667 domain-containing protein [Ignavibacteriales bacterium]